MRFALLIVASLLCVSCAKSHDIRSAKLEFESIQSRSENIFFDVNFYSDMELLELFRREKKANSYDQVFICALGEDTDFSVEHTISKAAMGLIEENKEPLRQAGFAYTARIAVKNVAEKKRSSTYLSREELEKLLVGKQSIPCKVVITATGYKAYYTQSMFIPVADILSALVDDSVKGETVSPASE
ncbi:hypothetical protein [Pseudomonas sp. NPDC087639]|uniref:hypothetical protein n=1 Tax=Pseudomonas sp. NPDC087639 TaxID=3364445 RepID=UPI003820A0ED